jgi:hypothetical protein
MKNLINNINILINAVNKAQKLGAYDLKEAALLFQVIQQLVESLEKPDQPEKEKNIAGSKARVEKTEQKSKSTTKK